MFVLIVLFSFFVPHVPVLNVIRNRRFEIALHKLISFKCDHVTGGPRVTIGSSTISYQYWTIDPSILSEIQKPIVNHEFVQIQSRFWFSRYQNALPSFYWWMKRLKTMEQTIQMIRSRFMDVMINNCFSVFILLIFVDYYCSTDK